MQRIEEEEQVVFLIVKAGAWKCLFDLCKNKGIKLKELKNKKNKSVGDFAEEAGWGDEYKFIESNIEQMLGGMDINTFEVIEQAKKAGLKECESTFLIASDEKCYMHSALPADAKESRARQQQLLPENEGRLKVIVGSPPSGILLMDDYLENDLWLNNCQSASIADILRVHEFSYIDHIKGLCSSIPEHSTGTELDTLLKLDRDTFISHESYNAATKGAGVVLAAIDAIMKGTCRTAFCAIRPPGHHAGPWGAVE